MELTSSPFEPTPSSRALQLVIPRFQKKQKKKKKEGSQASQTLKQAMDIDVSSAGTDFLEYISVLWFHSPTVSVLRIDSKLLCSGPSFRSLLETPSEGFKQARVLHCRNLKRAASMTFQRDARGCTAPPIEIPKNLELHIRTSLILHQAVATMIILQISCPISPKQLPTRRLRSQNCIVLRSHCLSQRTFLLSWSQEK